MVSQLIYHSFAIPTLTEQDIQDILQVARSFNGENNITGCLLFYQSEFLQILEGDKEIIENLYSRIKEDKRHKNVTTIFHSLYPMRLYSEWNMAYHPLQDQQMESLKNTLSLQEFTKLYELKENATESQHLFHFVATDIIENPYDNG